MVPAAYTSRTCRICGHESADNRRTQALFSCVACGHTENADVHAAKNILAAGHAVWARERQGAPGPAACGGRSDDRAAQAAWAQPRRSRNPPKRRSRQLDQNHGKRLNFKRSTAGWALSYTLPGHPGRLGRFASVYTINTQLPVLWSVPISCDASSSIARARISCARSRCSSSLNSNRKLVPLDTMRQTVMGPLPN